MTSCMSLFAFRLIRVAGSDALLGSSTRGTFFLARTGQDARQCIVALVAGVFIELAGGGIQRQLATEGLHEGGRVFDFELIEDAIGRGAREALDDLQVLVGTAEA